jgi:hypothetical protein
MTYYNEAPHPSVAEQGMRRFRARFTALDESSHCLILVVCITIHSDLIYDRHRRRAAWLSEFSEAIMGAGIRALGFAICDATLSAPLVHLNDAGAGIEVGLVAKLAGHASAVVTLGHYTQAVRGGEAAVAALEKAFAVSRYRDLQMERAKPELYHIEN